MAPTTVVLAAREVGGAAICECDESCRGCRDMEAYCDEYDPDRAYHGAIAEPGAWYDDYAAGFGDALSRC